MKFSASISVVIPNYNGRHLLEINLPFVFAALNHSTADFEVIVADDASTDDSVAWLEEHYPQIRLIANKKNGGFSKNINTGIRVATKELVLLLNSDVKLSLTYFDAQFKYFNISDTFGVQGRIMAMDSDLIQDGAKYPVAGPGGIKATLNYLPENFSKAVPTFFLSGANALVSRSKLNELQGFDEAYSPFYFEDVDLSLRAWRKGWTCYYEHAAVCEHPASTTISKHNKRSFVRKVAAANKMLLNDTHLDGLSHMFWWLNLMLKFIFSIFLFKTDFYWSFFTFLGKRRSRLATPVSRKINEIKHIILESVGRQNIVKF